MLKLCYGDRLKHYKIMGNTMDNFLKNHHFKFNYQIMFNKNLIPKFDRVWIKLLIAQFC